MTVGVPVAVGIALLLALLPAARASPVPIAKSVLTCTVGTGPLAAAYDPANHEMYVPNTHSASVTVLKKGCTAAATILLPAGSEPYGAAYDPINQDVYVAMSHLNSVYEISGTTVVANITNASFSEPDGILYNPAGQNIVITNDGNARVAFISGTTVQGFAPVGTFPNYVGYDPHASTLLVTNWGSGNVTVLNATTWANVANVAVGTNPAGVAYDPADEQDYVAVYGMNSVVEMSGLGVINTTIKGFDEPGGVVWVPSVDRIWVTNAGNGRISFVSGSKVVGKKSTAGIDIISATYDPANKEVYVPDFDHAAGTVVYIVR
jgi:YVTN family beta-propeller protein